MFPYICIYIEKTLLCLTYLLGPGAPGVSFCEDKGGARGGVYMWLQKWLAFLGRGMVVSKPVLQWTFPISLNHIHCLGAKYARMTFSDEAFNIFGPRWASSGVSILSHVSSEGFDGRSVLINEEQIKPDRNRSRIGTRSELGRDLGRNWT